GQVALEEVVVGLERRSVEPGADDLGLAAGDDGRALRDGEDLPALRQRRARPREEGGAGLCGAGTEPLARVEQVPGLGRSLVRLRLLAGEQIEQARGWDRIPLRVDRGAGQVGLEVLQFELGGL